MSGDIHPLPQYAFMAWCLVKAQGQLYLFLPYPLDRRLGGPQSRSGRSGEEKNSQPLPGLEPPIIQPLAQLSRLLDFSRAN
jgi:hypothetical protein